MKLFLCGDEIVIDTVNKQTLAERKKNKEKENKLYQRSVPMGRRSPHSEMLWLSLTLIRR